MNRFLSAFLSFLCAGSLWAQVELGSLVGMVSDPQKAPVAGASVEFKSSATNIKRQATTSASGEFDSLPLQPGRYIITIRQSGFREKAVEVWRHPEFRFAIAPGLARPLLP